MGLTRTMAVNWFEREREYQDREWGATGSEARTVLGYHSAAPHLLVLEEKVARLRKLWYEMPRSEEKKRKLFEEFAKVGAIALRALEEMDGPASLPPVQP